MRREALSPRLSPVASIIAPRWPPEESFYQRILADDPDEARAQALTPGALTGSRIERVTESIASLVEDLDEYEDRDPSQFDNDHTVTAPTRAEQDLPMQAATEKRIPPELPASWREPAPVICLEGVVLSAEGRLSR